MKGCTCFDLRPSFALQLTPAAKDYPYINCTGNRRDTQEKNAGTFMSINILLSDSLKSAKLALIPGAAEAVKPIKAGGT